MKIDWSTAPSWANYAAMDKDQEWYWYEFEPTSCKDGTWSNLRNAGHVTGIYVNWETSLQERPK